MTKRKCKRAFGVAFGLVLSGLLVACTAEVGINELYGEPGSTGLRVSVDSCNADPEVHVDESSEEIRLTVSVDGDQRNSGDCQDGVDVTLDEPLGDRVVVDGSTGGVVEVLRPDE